MKRLAGAVHHLAGAVHHLAGAAHHLAGATHHLASAAHQLLPLQLRVSLPTLLGCVRPLPYRLPRPPLPVLLSSARLLPLQLRVLPPTLLGCVQPVIAGPSDSSDAVWYIARR